MIALNPETAPKEKKSRQRKEVQWSMIMISILEENYQSVDDKELASMIGVGILEIKRTMREMKLARPKIKKDRKLRIQKLTPFQERVKVEKEKNTRSTQLMEENRRKRSGPLFKTKQLDLSEMHTVRLDAKTWIYIKPGEDVEAIKKKYTRHLSKDGLTKIEF